MKTAEQHYKEAIGETRFNLEGSVTKTQIIYAIESARNEALDHVRKWLGNYYGCIEAEVGDRYYEGKSDAYEEAISLIDQLKQKQHGKL